MWFNYYVELVLNNALAAKSVVHALGGVQWPDFLISSEMYTLGRERVRPRYSTAA